jgi:hypothetical protein
MDKLDVQVAREKTQRIVREFLCEIIDPDLANETNQVARTFIGYYHEGVRNGEVTVQQAAQIDFGIGKTQTTAEVAAWWTTLTNGRLGIAVPRLDLAERLVKQLRAMRVDARVFRGRNAPDPDNPGRVMCWRPKYVDKAVTLHAKVDEACCYKNKNNKCIFVDRCGYYRQQPSKKEPQPRIWVFASDMIFHEHKVFAGLDALIVDESFWQKGIRGVDRETFVLTITDIGKSKKSDDGTLRLFRERLAMALARGEVAYYHFTPGECRHARILEWQAMPDHGMQPKDNEGEAKIEKNVLHARYLGRCRIKIWEELELLLYRDRHELSDVSDDTLASGRLTVMEEDGERLIRWRGVEDIRKNFQVPTLLLDATLPALPVLQVYHPEIKQVADIMVDMPKHVKLKQILKTPSSANKLEKERHLKSLRRYILKRWIECGRENALVITQEHAELWLRGNLPNNVAVEHYNNVAGRDDYRDVRLLILIGRPQPGPEAPEALAAALSGNQPITCKPGPTGFVWYQEVKRGIRLRDGRGIATDCYQHPDSFVESVRMMICEHELLQAIGRARGVNRTVTTPLDIDLLFDECLPRIAVDEVVSWQVPSLLFDTAYEGVMLTSPVDLMKTWPDLWPNHSVADRTLRAGVPELPGFVPVPYQLAGAKMNERLAYFDMSIVPYPISWIEEKLGLVAERFKDIERTVRSSRLADSDVEAMIALRHRGALSEWPASFL